MSELYLMKYINERHATAKEEDRCAFCAAYLRKVVFRDVVNIEESLLSALCQQCQDDIVESVQKNPQLLNLKETK